jgi:hypothetical protein
MSDFDRRFSVCLIIFACTVRSAYKATARDRFFSVTGRFHFIKEVRILGTPDPLDCKKFSGKDRFPLCPGPV